MDAISVGSPRNNCGDSYIVVHIYGHLIVSLELTRRQLWQRIGTVGRLLGHAGDGLRGTTKVVWVVKICAF